MLRAIVVIAILLTSTRASFACSIPVFRYALELWPASSYQLILFHDGPLSADDQKIAQQVRHSAGSAYVTFTMVNLDERVSAEHGVILEYEGANPLLPRLVLRYPDTRPNMPSAWSGSLDRAAALFDSKARRAIFDHLTTGDAAVIVLVLGGDADKDDAARKLLAEQLPRIASATVLPAKTEEGPQIKSRVPLHVRFPIVEVQRNADEDVLIRTLLGSEEGLNKEKGPIAFPVFGRGRALCSLYGNDLKGPAELRRSLDFLCRACSCQAKELNPGIDLMIAGDWTVIFSAEEGPMPRSVTVPGSELKPSNSGTHHGELRRGPPANYSAVDVIEEKTSRRSPWLRLGLITAAITVFVTGFWAFRSRRTASTEQT
jgi:hypothetical protein